MRTNFEFVTLSKMVVGTVIPEDLSALKRPALQKLCKKLGIKANGKNSAMILALEEMRKAMKEEVMDEDAAGEDAAGEDAASEDAASEDAADEGAAVPQMNKSLPVHDKTTPKRSPSSDMWTTPPSSLKSLAKPVIEDLISESHSNSTFNDRLSRKRKRRDTYSVSPNSSLLSADRQLETTPANTEPHNEMASSRQEVSSSSEITNSSQKQKNILTSSPIESTVASTDSLCPSAKRKKDFMYGPILLENIADNVGTGMRSDVQCAAGAEEGSNIKDNILSLLEQRVKERKADPNYIKPEPTSSSRLPIKTTTISKKFDRAHQKNFERMQSIAYSGVTGLNKRKSLTSIARANSRRNSTVSKLSKTSERSGTVCKVILSKPGNVPFKPSVTNTRKVDLKFASGTEKKVPYSSVSSNKEDKNISNSRIRTTLFYIAFFFLLAVMCFVLSHTMAIY